MTIGQDPFTLLHPAIRHHIANTLGWRSLRPLQEDSVAPLLAGDDALLLAPTAGGKTEAVSFPILSALENHSATGLSALYICPIKALLNNLQPRLAQYAAWLGRTVEVRHGDTTASARARQLTTPPDILLTTPESLEAVLVSTKTDHERLLRNLRTVIVDEVHAFAGDDRGWHLLSLLERLCVIADRRMQRIGLSATVGNAPELLSWLQGNHPEPRPGHVIAPGVDLNAAVLPSTATPDTDRTPDTDHTPAASTTGVDMSLDYVGTMDNAAQLIAALHTGQKRLVFADSRSSVEDLAGFLRERNVATFVSHSSLSLDERRRSEQAFAEARDCVIVSTSTLELGIDVGDLDRVMQIGAPATVASMLQRLGRTGRRTGTTRNMLFVSVKDPHVLSAAGLCLLWSEGYVEPVHAPSTPHHIAAQQLLGLVLQQGRIERRNWWKPITGSGVVDPTLADRIADWLLDTSHLTNDNGVLAIGPEAERRYGKRHFLDILAVFAAPPQFLVRLGRTDLGYVDPMVLTVPTEGSRNITLGGRGWVVTHIDWQRKITQVEPSTQGGRMLWTSSGHASSFALADAQRRVLLGANPLATHLSERAIKRLAALRAEYAHLVDHEATVVDHSGATPRWWTFAGLRANLTLAAALEATTPGLIDPDRTVQDKHIQLLDGATGIELTAALRQLRADPTTLREAKPPVDEAAVKGLKFHEMLPPDMARATLSARLVDIDGATTVSRRAVLDWHPR